MFHWSTFQPKWWTCFTLLVLFGSITRSVSGDHTNESGFRHDASTADMASTVRSVEIVPLSHREAPQSLHEAQHSVIVPEETSKDSSSLQNHIVDPAAEPRRRTNKLTTQQVPRALVNPLVPSLSNRTGQHPTDGRWEAGEVHFDFGRTAEETPQGQVPTSVNLTSVLEIGDRTLAEEVERGTEESEWVTIVPNTASQDVEYFSGNGESRVPSNLTATSPDDHTVAQNIRNHSNPGAEFLVVEDDALPIVEELLRATNESQTLKPPSDSVRHLQGPTEVKDSVSLLNASSRSQTPANPESVQSVISLVLSSYVIKVPEIPVILLSTVRDVASTSTVWDATIENTNPGTDLQATLSQDGIEDLQSGSFVTPSFVPSVEIVSSFLVPVTKNSLFLSESGTLTEDSTATSIYSSAELLYKNSTSDFTLTNSSALADASGQSNSSQKSESSSFNPSYQDAQSNLSPHFPAAFLVTPSFSISTTFPGSLSTSMSVPTGVPNNSEQSFSAATLQLTVPHLNESTSAEFPTNSSPLPESLNVMEINPTKSSADKGNGHGSSLNSARARDLELKVGTDTERKALDESVKDEMLSNVSKTIEVHQSLDDPTKPDPEVVTINETITQLSPLDSSISFEQFTKFDILSMPYFSSIMSSTIFNGTEMNLSNQSASTEASQLNTTNATDALTSKSLPSFIPSEPPNDTRSEAKYTTESRDKQSAVSTVAKPLGVLPTVKVPLTYLFLKMRWSWAFFCARQDDFQKTLAQQLSNAAKYSIKDSQLVLFNTNACNHISTGVIDLNDVTRSTISVPLYVVDRRGEYSKTLTEKLGLVLLKNGLQGFKDNVTLQEVVLAVQVNRTNATSTTSEKSSIFENDTGIIAAVTISCIAGICLLLLCFLLVVLKRRHGLTKQTRRCRKVTDAYSLDSISIYSSFYKRRLRASKRSYLNQGFEDPQAPANKLTYSGMVKFCSNEEDVIEEYKKIPMTVAKLEDLPPGADIKNRYANVIPFPETRVQLVVKGDDPSSEYINANYVRGFLGDQHVYIACQAPLESTVIDFWEMVWENQSKVVIMLTALEEDGVEKCAPYFAESAAIDSHRLFGDFQVTTKKIDARETLTISFLQLKNLEKNLMREVVHFWCMAWPAQSLPNDSMPIIEMLLEARPLMKVNPGPNVVHCSPGTGRTGTVIAIDICMQEYESARSVDVPQCVYRLRRDRGGLVQTSEQYLYIYKTLMEYASRIMNHSGRSSLRSIK